MAWRPRNTPPSPTTCGRRMEGRERRAHGHRMGSAVHFNGAAGINLDAAITLPTEMRSWLKILPIAVSSFIKSIRQVYRQAGRASALQLSHLSGYRESASAFLRFSLGPRVHFRARKVGR